MRVFGAATLMALLFLLSGCASDDRSAAYGLFGSEALVLVQDGETLTVLVFPPALVDGYASHTGKSRPDALRQFVGVPATTVFGGDESDLARLRNLTATLAAETGGISYGEVTDPMRFDALFAYADDLRKTALPDTLQGLSGLDRFLGRFSDVRQCRTFDVGTFVTIDTDTDWEALRLTFRQWLEEALLLDRRGDN